MNSNPEPHYQLAVIGAGPAGLSAAALASELGIKTALFDEQKSPGGQIYRNIESIPEQRAQLLGSEYRHGNEIIDEFRQSSVDYFNATSVWSLKASGELGINREGKAQLITADHILIATGAQERPVPFPGWLLPGVMNAGGGQILLKQAGMVPDAPVVLAGTGPLLLLLAWQYMRLGVKIKAMLDVQPVSNFFRALPHLPNALLAHHYILKGFEYKSAIRKAGIKTLYNVQQLHGLGGDSLHAVEFIHKGKIHRFETRLLLTHFGVIPQLHLAGMAGCRLKWDKVQQCWKPQTNQWGLSSIKNISIAGDCSTIGGARTAAHEGRIAAFSIAERFGFLTRSECRDKAKADLKWMKDELKIRPFLDTLFRPPSIMLQHPTDEQVICRCEEITAGQIRRSIESGQKSVNAIKFFTRSGMGPCQGRQCANPLVHLTAYETGKDPAKTNPYRSRPPIKPLTLGELAALYKPDS